MYISLEFVASQAQLWKKIFPVHYKGKINFKIIASVASYKGTHTMFDKHLKTPENQGPERCDRECKTELKAPSRTKRHLQSSTPCWTRQQSPALLWDRLQLEQAGWDIVLVSAGTEFILAAGMVLFFGFSVRTMLITHWCFLVAKQSLP